MLSFEQVEEEKEALRQEYEGCLGLLESYFLEAVASGNWEEFDLFVSHFKSPVEGKESNSSPYPKPFLSLVSLLQ